MHWKYCRELIALWQAPGVFIIGDPKVLFIRTLQMVGKEIRPEAHKPAFILYACSLLYVISCSTRSTESTSMGFFIQNTVISKLVTSLNVKRHLTKCHGWRRAEKNAWELLYSWDPTCLFMSPEMFAGLKKELKNINKLTYLQLISQDLNLI